MMLRTTLFALFSLAVLAAPRAQAEGELMVMPARLKVFNGHEYGVTVKNEGDAPLFLSISLQKVMNPGFEPEDKVLLGQLERPSLLATPDKLTLGPGQSRSVSLKSLSVPTTEEMYRLYIIPVRAMLVDEAPQSKITAPMSIAVGYGVLIRHMPPPGEQRSSWSYRCESTGVLLENTGNVRLILSNIATPDGKPQPDRVALFPGTSRQFGGKNLTMLIEQTPQTFDCGE